MKISMKPESTLGAVSVGLNAFSVLTGIILYILAGRLKIVTSDLLIGIFAMTAVIASIVAFAAAFLAVVIRGERSALTFLSFLTGLAVVGFIAGNLIGARV